MLGRAIADARTGGSAMAHVRRDRRAVGAYWLRSRRTAGGQLRPVIAVVGASVPTFLARYSLQVALA